MRIPVFLSQFFFLTSGVLLTLTDRCPALDTSPPIHATDTSTQSSPPTSPATQCPVPSTPSNGIGTTRQGLTITSSWYDFDNQLASAEVHLPNQYLESPVMFRSKRPNETSLNYLKAAVQQLKTVDFLQIPPGEYDIRRINETQMTALILNDLSDKTIDFCGATVSLYDPMTFLHLFNSKRIAIRNLRIVHRYPLASLGYVENNNGDYRLRVASPYIELLKLFPSQFHTIATVYQANEDILTGAPSFLWRKNGSSFRLIDKTLIQEGIESYDPNTGVYHVRSGHPLSTEIKRLGEQGSPVLIKHHSHGVNGISAASSEDLTLEHLRFNGIPGMALYLADISSGVLIRHCTVQANKQEDPLALFGTTADGFHVQAAKNVIIAGNRISDLGDDGVNVYHGQFLRVIQNFGSQIQVARVGGGAPISLSENMSVTVYSPNLTLKHSNILLTRIKGSRTLSPGQSTTLQLSQPALSAVANTDFITLNEATSQRVFIGNNIIQNSTARGILTQAKTVMIKGNQIKDIARNAIKVTSDTLWFYEAGLPENIKISQNKISNTTWDHLDWQPNTSSPSAINAAIEINPIERADGKPYGMTGSIKKLSVLNNQVSEVPTSFGYFGVQGLKAFSNQFSSTPDFLLLKKPGSQFGWSITGPIFGEGSKDCQANFTHFCL